MQSAADVTASSITHMATRVHATIPCYRSDLGLIIPQLEQARRAVIGMLRVLIQSCDKVLDEKAEAADTASKQLTAVAAMCERGTDYISTWHWSSRVSDLLHGSFGTVVTVCVPVSTLPLSTLASMSAVWCELPDGAVSTVSGPGTNRFVKGAAGVTHNVVLVYPRVPTVVACQCLRSM